MSYRQEAKQDEFTQVRNDLTLILLYLNSWEEKAHDERRLKSWKGHDFGTLNELDGQRLIRMENMSSKSLELTSEGEERAKQLIKVLTD